MQPPRDTLQESIARQREALAARLRDPLRRAAEGCAAVWAERQAMDAALSRVLEELPYCEFLYALDAQAVQITDNVSHDGLVEQDFGRDRSDRPYMREADPAREFILSDAYISLRKERPSLTAIQIVRGAGGELLGYVGADFDLRNLPLTRELYEEPRYWRQIKGDPSIRGTVFHQTRAESGLDRHMDTVTGVLEELMLDHGVYHVIVHFSSSRAIIWLMDDPYRYRMLDLESLIDPDICLAYPRRPYPAEAVVPADQIRPILDALAQLRVMDEMLYLRSGSLNVFNGIVGLTFSCDGSHYLPHDEFLDKEHEFWVRGAGGASADAG